MTLESVATISTPSTVPVGTKIAVDTLASGEVVQMVKLVDGSPNGEQFIPGDSTLGLSVNVKNATVPVSGTVTVTGSVTAAANVQQLNGQTVDLGIANVGTGTQRVVLASNQPSVAVGATLAAETTKVIGTVNVAAGQSVGITGAPAAGGALPVSLATVPSHAVTVTSGAITADTELNAPLALADGITTGALPSGNPVDAVGLAFNGTSYDRVRVANQGVQIAASSPGVLVIQGTGVAGAVPISGSITTTAGPADNGTFTQGTTPVTPNGYLYDDVVTVVPGEDNVAAARIDAKRAQVLVIEDYTVRGSGRRAGVNANHELLVSGNVVAGVAPTGNLVATVQGHASGIALPVSAPVSAPLFVTSTPTTGGGWSFASALALNATLVAVKTSPGTLGGYVIHNPSAATAYVQVFDVASPTLGTPGYVWGIPAGATANVEFANGILHTNSIRLAATTTPTGSTAPATPLVAAIYYK